MISFIKSYNLENIRKKLVLLYFLNVTDILFTLALLKTGLFREMNIFMAEIVKHPFVSIVLKVAFPAVLLFFIFRKLSDMDYEELKAANIGILISLTIYSLVNLTHIIWMVMLPAFLFKL